MIAETLAGFMILVAFDLAGEGIVRALCIPFPGPVVGMLLYLGALVLRGGLAASTQRSAGFLLRHLSLFFVPAGVGILTQVEVIRREWGPLMVAVVLSTLVALAAGSVAFAWAARAERGAR